MMSNVEQPFAELPGALVEDMMQQAYGIGEQYIAQIEQVRTQREDIRRQMTSKGMLAKAGSLPLVEAPTTCGVDGARITERLLATDIVAITAIAVEGMTPPSEKYHWSKPHHEVMLKMETHHAYTDRIATGLMIAMELHQAVNAPHDVKFIDNSLATPVIQLNQAVVAAIEAPELTISAELEKRMPDALKNYLSIVSNSQSDRAYVGVPKYTSDDGISSLLNITGYKNDRNLMTIVLEAGEYTEPRPLKSPNSPWHINVSNLNASDSIGLQTMANEACEKLNDVHIIYYRPKDQMPALRLETTASTAQNRHQLSALLSAVQNQCQSATTMEPFPLFIADRMVKNISPAMAAVIGLTTSHSGLNYSGPTSDIYHGLHSYRT